MDSDLGKQIVTHTNERKRGKEKKWRRNERGGKEGDRSHRHHTLPECLVAVFTDGPIALFLLLLLHLCVLLWMSSACMCGMVCGV